MNLSPTSSGLLDAIRQTDWQNRSAYARVLSKIYYAANPPTNLLDEQWDYLFVLDAARADLFRRALTSVAPDLVESLSTIVSVGSTTREWGYNTFHGRQLSDYGYVTATPMVHQFDLDVNPSTSFDPFIDVSENRPDLFAQFGTVPPHLTSEAVVDHLSEQPEHRWICHYLQPHLPFIAPDVNHDVLPVFVTDPDDDSVWDLLAAGDVDIESVESAYLANHRFVLQEVLWLLGELPPGKRVLISSDHGNVLGGWHGYYGHGEGMYLPGLVKVPYLVVETGEALAEQPPNVDPSTDNKTEFDSVEDRLVALGYRE